MEMIFTNGEIMASPSPDIEKVYEGPYYSFFSWSDPPTGSELESVSAAYQLIYDVIEEEGPFDGILIAAAPLTIPEGLLEQLAIGGRLIVPVGPEGEQKLMRLTRREQGVERRVLGSVSFVPMLGGVS